MFLHHRLGAQPIPDALRVADLLKSDAVDDPKTARRFGEILVEAATRVGEDKIYLSFDGIASATHEALVAMGTPAIDIGLLLDVTGVANGSINAAVAQAAEELCDAWEAKLAAA